MASAWGVNAVRRGVHVGHRMAAPLGAPQRSAFS
jgi:hypothetical protein